MTEKQLLEALDRAKALMISVATGGVRIGEVEHEFGELHDAIDRELRRRGISESLPYRDLWLWHGRWSGGDLPTYSSRRQFVAQLIDPIAKRLRNGYQPALPPTGWERVDREAAEIRLQMSRANAEEQYQAVGLLCRELLISTSQAVFDAAEHPTVDGVPASKTDAKRMFEAYIEVALVGSSNDHLRKHVRAAYDLATHLQHRRTASFRDAAICVEATLSVVNIIAIIAGRRQPGSAS
jgi:hypothetical protein